MSLKSAELDRQRRALKPPSNSKHVLRFLNTCTPTTSTNPDLILPSLYLTDLHTVRGILSPSYTIPTSGSTTARPKIKYILSLLSDSLSQPHPKPPLKASDYVQRLIILDDFPTSNLLLLLADACDWIDECLAKGDGGVVVHCQLGQSRSASVVVGYVMRREGLGFEEALMKVKKRRACVRINAGFVEQLGLWAVMGFDCWERSDGEVGHGEVTQIRREEGTMGEGEQGEARRGPVWKEKEVKVVERRFKQGYLDWKVRSDRIKKGSISLLLANRDSSTEREGLPGTQ